MTDAERAAALAALAREILEGFNSDPRSPYTLISRLTRDAHMTYLNRLAALEGGPK